MSTQLLASDGAGPQGLRLQRLRLRSEGGPQGSIPVLVAAMPDTQPRPVVVWLHGTGGSKEELLPQLQEYAAAGYLAVAMDARYHGERAAAGDDGVDARTAYQHALIRAWRDETPEHPFLLDNAFDLLALLDYLCGRSDVDRARIGLTGISLGGMHTWLATVLDKRVAVAAPIIGIQHWGWALEHDQWHGRASSVPLLFEAAAADCGAPGLDRHVVERVVRKLLPGLLDDWDTPASLGCVAPRPLLIANAELDPRCPMDGVRIALAAAAEAYAAAGAPANLELYVEVGCEHRCTEGLLAAVRVWLDKHLLL